MLTEYGVNHLTEKKSNQYLKMLLRSCAPWFTNCHKIVFTIIVLTSFIQAAVSADDTNICACVPFYTCQDGTPDIYGKDIFALRLV